MGTRLQAPGAVTSLPDTFMHELEDIVGAANVRTDDVYRVDAGRDWWPLTKVWIRNGDQPAMPAVVVRPGNADGVAAVLAAANAARVPVTPFAGRSGVCGGSLPVYGGISLDLQRLDRIHAVDTDNLMVNVDAGVYGPVLEEHIQKQGVTVGHFPQSFDIATVGGWIACRGAGQYSNRYGKIEDIVLAVEVALADGTMLQTNPVPAAATGPDLMRLFVGSEGTLGVITSAWLKAWPAAESVWKRAYSFDSFAAAVEALRLIMRTGARPAVTRVYDGPETARHFGLPDDRNALIVFVEGSADHAAFESRAVESVVAALGDTGRPEDDALVDRWFESRNDVSALDLVVDHDMLVDTIEIAAPWSQLAPTYEAVKAGVVEAAVGERPWVMCTSHSSHAYMTGGCLYFTFVGPAGDTPDDVDRFYVKCWDAAMRAVRSNGGTISHHHGIGLVRARWLAEELGPGGMQILKAMKATLDPNGILNPGKLGLGDDPPAWPSS